MAIAKFSDIIGDLSGRVSGAVIARNLHATYARPFRTSTNPDSISQAAHRSKYSRIATAWSALTQLQRSAYDAYAADTANYVTNRLGDDVPLSGWQWFFRTSQNRILCSLAPTNAPPTEAVPTATTITLLKCWLTTGNVNHAQIWFTPGFFTNYYAIISSSFSPTIAALVKNTGFRTTRVYPPFAGLSIGLTTNVVNLFGNLILNSTFHCRIAAAWPSGLRGPFAQASIPVTSEP